MNHRFVRLLLVLVVSILGLAGCSSGPPGRDGQYRSPTAAGSTLSARPSPGHPTSPTSRDGVDKLLSDIVRAVDTGDRSLFDSLVSDQDPGFRTTAGMIRDNLLEIHPADFALRPTGRRRDLSGRRSQVLGRNAYAVEVDVSWSVPGDRAPSDQRVWMTIARSGAGLRWAGVADGPPQQRPTPLWWLEPVDYRHSGNATVISGNQIDAANWAAAANTAISKDAPRLPGFGWNRRLVIIVPSNERLMEQTLGDVPGTNTALAAITWPDGSRAATAPIRILINPAGVRSPLATAIVLSHETVHVATRSPLSPAPTWLVEGFADYIAYRNYPQGVQPAAAELLADVKRHGPPNALPGASAFSVGRTDLNRSYAEAWLACRYLAGRFGEPRLLRFYAAVDRSRDGSIAGPAHAVFGISEHRLVRGWQRYLQSAAERGRI
ncbi:MAG: hypothetical protein J2P23_12970 [Microlunatus sp.]|nr:hypothetical protein [Microlunatus sp.]